QVKLEIVKAEYGAGSQQKDVTDILRKQASDSPLIPLAASGYNASFGGDPAPGVVKQLKIQYRINDKTSEATFAENALILLPLPK
ncbi:MAG TPA: PBS lyase, partial [Planctomycetaceae bacterium]|nr:PBS lyase [Planctomycetaceae bacterium]